ncbi:MAG: GAF domain-containing protein [Vicinamibacteria bacterium]|nr:GAF domain-containing protein [Vicinamibacteria bacterium]
MAPAPLHPREARRLDLLRLHRILDTGAEPVFDELTQLAAEICGTPIGLISLVDEDRQWFKSRVGITATETSRDIAFCAHAILGERVFTVADASRDPRFDDNPLVREEPKVRFYAGFPLAVEEGLPLGTLCVLDREPRQLTAAQELALERLGRMAVALLRMRRTALELEPLEALLSMCAFCRQVKDEKGAWVGVEAYLDASERITHGICPNCMETRFAEEAARIRAGERRGK